MYGLPRSLSDGTKLALVLRTLGLNPERFDGRLYDDVATALFDHYAKRSRLGLPIRQVDGAPMNDRDIRDAAYVLAALVAPERIRALLRADEIARYAGRTEAWLKPVADRHGLRWTWSGQMERPALVA